MAVTQKTAERSYREHIEQQIQTYQRRWATPPPRALPLPLLPIRASGGAGSVTETRSPVDPVPVRHLLFNHTGRVEREAASPTAALVLGAAVASLPGGWAARAAG